ncbi:MAG: hypothetical protein FJW86_04950 [Actinobacteria bacterium]|nr:hypothetical protein [Actinomycetota bacterium]
MTHRLRRLLVLLGLTAIAVGVLAAPAGAHANLLESRPSQGQVLQIAPDEISLSFSEPVDASFGAVRVYDADSNRLEAGEVETRNNLVILPLSEVPNGSYVVTYRVTSRDAHPVNGAFTFQVGNAGNAFSPRAQALAQELLSGEEGEQVVGAIYGISRGLLFAGLALMIGCVTFGVIVWARARAVTINRRLVWIGWGTTMVATIVSVLVYGPYAAGVGLGDVFESELVDATIDSRYGQMGIARIGLLLLGLPILWMLLARDGDEPRPVPRPWLGAAAVFGVLVAATPGLAGHATSGDLVELAVAADTIHVLAMALWLGGLATLATVVLRRGWKAAQIEQPISTWSRFALWCVVAIMATGTFQAIRQVGNLTALRSTEYGRMLVIKLVLFTALLVLAVFSREAVHMLWPKPVEKSGRRVPVVAGGADDHSPPALTKAQRAAHEATELRRLRRSVCAEVLGGILVLSITALLVNAPPAKGAAENAQGNAIGVTLKARGVWVDVAVVPGQRGQNAVHVSALTPSGKVKDVTDLTITFDLPNEDIVGLEVPLAKISAGHFTATGFALPIEGTWQITAKVVVSEFTQRTIRSEIDIDD